VKVKIFLLGVVINNGNSWGGTGFVRVHQYCVLQFNNKKKMEPTTYILYKYNDYLFNHSNVFQCISHLKGYH